MDNELKQHLIEMENRIVRRIEASIEIKMNEVEFRLNRKIDAPFDEPMHAFRQWAAPLEAELYRTAADIRDLKDRVELLEKRLSA